TIGVVTVGLSDYSVLLPVLRQIQDDPDLKLYLMLAGAHLSPEFGLTVEAIEADGFRIDERVSMLLSSDTPEGIAKSMGLGTMGFAQSFARFRPDILVVLGDRFEMYTAALAALPFKIPVAHIHGGEITQGAIDDALRHSMTKLSHLHFVSAPEYGERVRQLGEEPWRITISGAPSLDNIRSVQLLEAEELESRYGIDLKSEPLLVTYHPVTLEFEVSPEQQISNIFEAIRPYGYQLVITSPNIDTDREKILSLIKEEVNGNPEMFFFDSLGSKTYHNLIPECEFVIGNSSSGLTEVPFFRLPTLNVGDRQNGRIRHKSVIDTDYSVDHIKKGIEMTMSKDFRKSLKEMRFKFGDGHAAEKMVDIISKVSIDQKLMRKKLYYS
ncbi:MAG: UDP-N-acetylglucosamine 2-epimerase (hydrolyzing), partial [Planctomycetes bacterium]|nr:UDP-N-acetylglucosamine 2-epimerase (hydrolyzing) [Planctomycetota bacterium]